MTTFKFGAMPKKTIDIDEDGNVNVTGKVYVNGEFNISEIKVVYVKKASIAEHGNCFLSFTGEPIANPVIFSNGFIYTRKQEEDLNKFLELLQEKNEEITVDTVSGFGVQQVQQAQKVKKEKVNKHALKCPKCKSTNVVFMDNNKKGFSVGKAVVGGALTGGIGTLAGFAGKKGKDRWHCNDCGNVFQKK
ncbi:hypothetical protein [Alkalibacterium sp. 20]|uniref:hypothetical protein n=1 Tax=Alkalibacterium sp. 20 TaxID=1798803 RepID=UPI0008FFEC70|nr:hypothetical protein [Alkalibacterium sp. 20]OJF96206.1 hypothetical protein AX762_05595 [Alkalibacterium sp. 20]